MLQVKTYLDKSPIHGFGLFADEDISKGTIVWRMSSLDMILEQEEFDKLPEVAQAYICHHGDWDIVMQKITMSFDNDKFINHESNTPNLTYNKNQTTEANRDIKKGEEITINYFEFDEKAMEKLFVKRNPADQWTFGKIK
mgnify:CR=1 FL=1